MDDNGPLRVVLVDAEPLAIERLGSLLEDKEARAKFEGFVHDLLHRFLGDLKFHLW